MTELVAAAAFAATACRQFFLGGQAAQLKSFGEMLLHCFLQLMELLLGVYEALGDGISENLFPQSLVAVDLVISKAEALGLLVLKMFAALHQLLIGILGLFIGKKSVNVQSDCVKRGIVQDALAKLACFGVYDSA